MDQQQEQPPLEAAAAQQAQQQPQLPRQPMLQLIDEEEWFNLYGLREAAANQPPKAGDLETSDRISRELSYGKAVSDKIFAEEDTQNKQAREAATTKRSEQLKKWNKETIDILTSVMDQETTNESLSPKKRNRDEEKMDKMEEDDDMKNNSTTTAIITTNLGKLAARSDTVFAIASNKYTFQQRSSEDEIITHKNATTNPSGNSSSYISLSLLDYSKESVQSFLEALLKDDQQQHQHIIPPEHVIDCCRLAHYLQCPPLLESIVDEYLLTSIDHENCRFLCKLADELSLPRLWEAAINHMLSSLDRFNSNNNNCTKTSQDSKNDNDDTNTSQTANSNLWDDFSPALKAEIQALRGILRSSHRQTVYFSTYHEYLGLLAEQHQYYRERLEDARYAQTVRMEEIHQHQQRLETLLEEQASNHRWLRHNLRLDKTIQQTKDRLEGLHKGKEYADEKIQRQTHKVDTLKALWKEQKKVFGGGSCESEEKKLVFEKHQQQQ